MLAMVWLSPPPLCFSAGVSMSVHAIPNLLTLQVQLYLLASEATSKQPPPDLELGKMRMKPCLSAYGIIPDSDE